VAAWRLFGLKTFIHIACLVWVVLRCGAALVLSHVSRPLSTVHSGDVTAVHSGYQSAL